MVGGVGGGWNSMCGISSSGGSSISSRSGCVTGVTSVGSVASRVDGASVACVGGVVGDARGVGGNGGGVRVAGSNGHRSNWGRSRGNSNRSRSNGDGSSGNNRSASRDDKEVRSRGVAVGDGFVLSGDCLLSKREKII